MSLQGLIHSMRSEGASRRQNQILMQKLSNVLISNSFNPKRINFFNRERRPSYCARMRSAIADAVITVPTPLIPPAPHCALAPFLPPFSDFRDLRHLRSPKPDLILQVEVSSSQVKQAGTMLSNKEGMALQLACMPSPVNLAKSSLSFPTIPLVVCGAEKATGTKTKAQTKATNKIVCFDIVFCPRYPKQWSL